MIRLIQQALGPVKRRVANMVARAVVQLADDTLKMQVLQLGILDGETRASIERFQNYGFTSVPESGAEAAVVFIGGDRDHGLAIVVDDRRYRLHSLESGEVAVYDKTGSSIVLKQNGDIVVTPSSGTLSLVGDMTVSGDVDVSGTVTGTTDVVGGGISLKTHVHSGVTTGSGSSGPPV